MLTRDLILAADDLKRIEVAVPEWGGSVWVRTMTGSELWGFQESHAGKKLTARDVVADFLTRVICNADGSLVFKPEDVDALAGKNPAVLQRLFDAARKVNPISEADVQDAAKN